MSNIVAIVRNHNLINFCVNIKFHQNFKLCIFVLMLRSCAFKTENLGVLVSCIGLLSEWHASVYSFRKFSISRRFLEAWRILTLLCWTWVTQTHVCVSWGHVLAQFGSFEKLENFFEFDESDIKQQAQYVSCGWAHITSAKLILKVKDFLLLFRTRYCLALGMLGCVPWECVLAQLEASKNWRTFEGLNLLNRT